MAVKVLIVDDSLLFREALARSLADDASIVVVGKASDAFDAEKKIAELNPDVVTLDVEMPKMNGIDFLRKQMAIKPIPVVVVTASPLSAFEALNAGAVEFIKKPLVKGADELKAFSEKMRHTIKIASIARVRTKPLTAIHANLSGYVVNSARSRNLIIALGASTGGTDALQTVVQDLPVNTPGIVITQHMPAGFTKMYAERLNRICKMTVKEAEDGDRIETGKIIVAAGGLQMRVYKDTNGFYIKSQPGEKVSGHCPSVDALFDSVAAAAGKNVIAAILTGMGSDGAKGLKKLKDLGAYTIGQDKESCVVYGMPMVAFNIGAVIEQAPLSEIPKIILDKCK